MLLLCKSISFGPRIVKFVAVIMLSCCLLSLLFFVFIVVSALIALEYCVWSSDFGV